MLKRNIKISVLVTVYNRFKLLQANLISLANQSIVPHEVIISDDGSEEPILLRLKELKEGLPYDLIYVRQEHRGFHAARVRNNAARQSSGELLIFLDQDIIGTKGFIKTFADHSKPGLFGVAWPIRLSESQTRRITRDMLVSGNFAGVITREQRQKIAKQFRKERLYTWLHAVRLRRFGPKLRSGVFSLYRHDYVKVNGFDEEYHGWGNEDDDLGRRLHAAGIQGINPFWHEYPLHLYHEPNRNGLERPNKDYYTQRIAEIHEGDYRCRFGLDNPRDHEELMIVRL